MIRIGFIEALAYRAEMLVWILSTTMPLVMLVLWHAVAREQPIGRFGSDQFVAYFLSMFIVRQLTGSWSVWLMNMEIRDGTLAMRLLRPVHPLLAYAMTSLSELPVRSLLSVPIAAVVLFILEGHELSHDPWIWAIWTFSIVAAWLITLLTNLVIGCLAFFLESSLKVMDVWLAFYFVFSGYMVPIEIFPAALRSVIDFLPFRYQLGLPVELMIGMHDRSEALAMLGRQWMMVGVLFAILVLVWQRGIRRFEAYGG
jgi:ABC-2 type transport system permease protein